MCYKPMIIIFFILFKNINVLSLSLSLLIIIIIITIIVVVVVVVIVVLSSECCISFFQKCIEKGLLSSLFCFFLREGCTIFCATLCKDENVKICYCIHSFLFFACLLFNLIMEFACSASPISLLPKIFARSHFRFTLMTSSYFELEKHFSRIHDFSHFHALADWDLKCYIPEKSTNSRCQAMGTLACYISELTTDPKLKGLIEDATKNVSELSPKQAANLREMARVWKMENFLPSDFVRETTVLTSKAHTIWRESKEKNDFSLFLPIFKELVKNGQQMANYFLDGDKSKSPYEALLEIYESGMSLASLESVFDKIRSWLPGLLREVMEHQKKTHECYTAVKGTFPDEKQRALANDLMKVWKFNFDAGRLDTSAHPFTGMTKDDIRITTAYKPDNFEFSLHAVIHETGHAKYEQNGGLRDMISQPVCAARSLGVHESQSLFAEFQIGRSTEFIKFLVPMLKKHLGPEEAFTEENMLKVLRVVKPGYIRTEADEVCYPLHVILRFEIEKALIEGTLNPEDVPRVWNEKMKEYFGLETLGKDNVGCLQDVHWSQGAFGYFPTYALGAILAAQLMHTIRKELGSEAVDKAILSGDLTKIFEKQQEKIWDHGSMYLTEELIINATGEKLNADYLHEHLRKRYLLNE